MSARLGADGLFEGKVLSSVNNSAVAAILVALLFGSALALHHPCAERALMVGAAIWILWSESRRRHDMIHMFSHVARLDMMLMNPPIADPAPGMQQHILNAALKVAWDYSINGNEGHRAGHILAIGPAIELLKVGHCKGRGETMWQAGRPCLIQTQEGSSELQKFMNLDGAHIIDSTTGQIYAGQFFSASIDDVECGGAGASAAQTLSTVIGTITFKISSDGSIREFRSGKLAKKHCENRMAPTARSLPAPLDFLRNRLDISATELSVYRVRYQQWRDGSPFGAKGEISSMVVCQH